MSRPSEEKLEELRIAIRETFRIAVRASYHAQQINHPLPSEMPTPAADKGKVIELASMNGALRAQCMNLIKLSRPETSMNVFSPDEMMENNNIENIDDVDIDERILDQFLSHLKQDPDFGEIFVQSLTSGFQNAAKITEAEDKKIIDLLKTLDPKTRFDLDEIEEPYQGINFYAQGLVETLWPFREVPKLN